MKLLPLEEITGKGDRETKFTQVKRNNDKAIYKKFIGGEHCGYEIFKIRQQQETESFISGANFKLEAKELFPNESMFGVHAFMYHFKDEEGALEEYDAFTPSFTEKELSERLQLF